VKGSSTGILPNQVKIKKVPTWNQNINSPKKLYRLPFIFFVLNKGRIITIKIEKTRKMTPPSLFGIERRIA